MITVDKIAKGEYMQINENRGPQSTQKRSQPWLYRVVNSSFKVGFACIPLGVLYVVLAALIGFFGGIGSKVFAFTFNIFGG